MTGQAAGAGHRLWSLWRRWRLRHRRRYLILRGLRRSRALQVVRDRTGQIGADDVLLFAAMRNERERLPSFLAHYRALGVKHFLLVDNASTDGGPELLLDQPDVSLWHAGGSYKRARFGMDWVNGLLCRHGAGHWCLTVDLDELLIYPYWESRPLPALTGWLEMQGMESFGAMMLDLYPRGRLDLGGDTAWTDPLAHLQWFDSGNHVMRLQPELGNLWIQGGVRARRFFADDPRRAPTLGKVPLVRWSRRHAYVSSTHTLLPPRLNRATRDEEGGECISGILLHTKFLPSIPERSREERHRAEHFDNSQLYSAYYEELAQAPTLWSARSRRYMGWRQLEAMGLMSRGGWI